MRLAVWQRVFYSKIEIMQFNFLLTSAVAGVVFVSAAAGQVLQTVAPAGFENVDGSATLDSPLGITGPARADGYRFQQVYDDSLFGFTGPRLITEIQFRAATTANSFRPDSITTDQVMVYLSTTPTDGVPGMTANGNFADDFGSNIGADETLVRSGPLTLSRTGGSNPSGQAQPFNYGFMLDTPFEYDPSMGSLLLDIITPQGATVTAGAGFGAVENFDGVTAMNDGIASKRGTGSNIGDDNGQGAVESGLVTQFTTAPVPEPASLGLIAAAGLGLIRRR
jgi:hypothetical protein